MGCNLNVLRRMRGPHTQAHGPVTGVTVTDGSVRPGAGGAATHCSLSPRWPVPPCFNASDAPRGGRHVLR